MNATLLARPMAGPSQVDALRYRMLSGDRRRGDAGVPTLICASGRGGSGTSLLAALLAMSAAGDGYRVLLVDADEHVGPLAMLLQAPTTATWQDLRGGRLAPEEIATPISTTLTLVAGGAPRRLSPDGTALTAAERKACMRRVSTLGADMDLVVVDAGARFESVMAAITPHADERLVAVTADADPIGVASTYALCKAVQARCEGMPMDILVNRHDAGPAMRCFDTIDNGTRQFLGMPLRFAGAIPPDAALDTALRTGVPFHTAAAGSPAALAAHDIVLRAIAAATSSRPGIRS